jgi:predicted HTH transcriptional regulator
MRDGAMELERLILEPVETLEVEYKEWLDLRNNPHRAKLAKELIALANHGGGHVVIGFSDPEMTSRPKPDDYDYVTADYINGIVAAYAEPPFHCELTQVRDHLVISVPAGATVPIRSKKGSQNDEIIRDRYYTRRPGPNSEPPQSGLEWDTLLRRCIANNQWC